MSFAFLGTFPVWAGILIALVTCAAMELTAYSVHRWIMHGPLGWGWHRSHHEPHDDLLEKNDLYAVYFAVIAVALFWVGSQYAVWVWWVGAGVSLYGVLYFMAHDGLVHQRWPFRYVPRRGYLQRLYQAHKLHHAVDGRDGCVSFGFLWAPDVRVLKEQLKAGAEARSRNAEFATDRARSPADDRTKGRRATI